MLGTILGVLGGPINTVLERVLPDKEAREKAQQELIRLEQAGELQQVEAQLSAIIAEAKSSDPWTSRARPSFMYVMYVLFLAAIPFGVWYAIDPVQAAGFSGGMKQWFAALPEQLYWLFGTGYLGYTGARTYEKSRKGTITRGGQNNG